MVDLPVAEGLELRRLELHDAAAFFDLIAGNRDAFEQFLPWTPKIDNVASARTFIEAGLAAGEGLRLGIWWQDELVGGIGRRRIMPKFHSAELYYWLSTDTQGGGLMTRACRRFCHYLFTHEGLERLEIGCSVRNVRSRAVAERLGRVRKSSKPVEDAGDTKHRSKIGGTFFISCGDPPMTFEPINQPFHHVPLAVQLPVVMLWSLVALFWWNLQPNVTDSTHGASLPPAVRSICDQPFGAKSGSPLALPFDFSCIQ